MFRASKTSLSPPVVFTDRSQVPPQLFLFVRALVVPYVAFVLSLFLISLFLCLGRAFLFLLFFFIIIIYFYFHLFIYLFIYFVIVGFPGSSHIFIYIKLSCPKIVWTPLLTSGIS